MHIGMKGRIQSNGFPNSFLRLLCAAHYFSARPRWKKFRGNMGSNNQFFIFFFFNSFFVRFFVVPCMVKIACVVC